VKKVIICAIFVFAVFFLSYNIGCAQEKANVSFGVDAGSKAINFKLQDVKGKNVSLNDFIGKKVILLVFSATWCPACNEEIPELKELHNKYGKKGFKVLDVDIQESQKKVANFVKKKEIPYTVLLDLDGTVARQYKVRGIPTLMIIDKKGVIRERSYPPSSRFIPLFEKLLKE